MREGARAGGRGCSTQLDFFIEATRCWPQHDCDECICVKSQLVSETATGGQAGHVFLGGSTQVLLLDDDSMDMQCIKLNAFFHFIITHVLIQITANQVPGHNSLLTLIHAVLSTQSLTDRLINLVVVTLRHWTLAVVTAYDGSPDGCC